MGKYGISLTPDAHSELEARWNAAIETMVKVEGLLSLVAPPRDTTMTGEMTIGDLQLIRHDRVSGSDYRIEVLRDGEQLLAGYCHNSKRFEIQRDLKHFVPGLWVNEIQIAHDLEVQRRSEAKIADRKTTERKRLAERLRIVGLVPEDCIVEED